MSGPGPAAGGGMMPAEVIDREVKLFKLLERLARVRLSRAYFALALLLLAAAGIDWKTWLPVLVGFVAPWVLQRVPKALKDRKAAVVIFVASFLVAGGIGYLQGDFSGLNWASGNVIATAFVKLYATEQFVFSVFKDQFHLQDPPA